jgi:hypothetical protein
MKNLSFLLDALSMDLKEKQKKELHQSLVREIIRMRIQDRDKAHKWLNGYLNSADKWVKGFNELHPESTLNADIHKQWRLGNRGRIGEWYEEEDEKKSMETGKPD